MSSTIPAELAATIADPKAYQLQAPVDEAFAAIRRDYPLAVAHVEGFDPFWVVSRHADILQVEQDAETFHNGDRSTLLLAKDACELIRQFANGEANSNRSLVHTDGKEHRDLRSVTFKHFTPPNVRKLEGKIREIARGFVDQMLAKAPECDFAQDVAFLYPMRVIMTVLGVPPEDEALMLKLTQEVFSPNDPDLNRQGAEVSLLEAQAAFNQTMLDLEDYFEKVTEKFRANPADNVNSLIANAQINGEYLTHRQVMGYYIIAATAGHDTTSNNIAGALWALAERPELLAQLQADPGAIGSFVEESIRWVTPVKHFMRTATCDTQVNGVEIAKGDWLMLAYQSANRDEAVFDKPFEFDITRKPNNHAAFGYGRHVCLGQHLARLEMQILWEELLPRLQSVELAGEPKLTRSSFVCGPKSVPVRFTVK